MQKLSPSPFRVYTGPIKFEGDWPGYFYRGDDAKILADVLSHVASCLDDPLLAARLIRERDRLMECQVNRASDA